MMGCRSIAAAVTLALTIAAAATAHTVIAPDSGTSWPYQEWVDHAMTPTPPGTITVVDEPCPDGNANACTRPGDVVWVAPAIPRRAAHHIFLHELGHQFDYRVMTDGARARFIALARMDVTGWDVGEPGVMTPREFFATAYQVCARHRVERGRWRYASDERLVYPTTHTPVAPRQAHQMCRLIHGVSARRRNARAHRGARP